MSMLKIIWDLFFRIVCFSAASLWIYIAYQILSGNMRDIHANWFPISIALMAAAMAALEDTFKGWNQ